MLGVNVAISNLNVCETNVVVRLQIKDNDDTGKYKKRDGNAVVLDSFYNKLGTSNGLTYAGKPTREIPETLHSTRTRFWPYRPGCNNVYQEDSRPTGQAPVLHSDPPIQEDSTLVSTYIKGRDCYDNSSWKLQTALSDSESHRRSLANKLQETRSVVEEQNNKLRKIESAAIDNSFLMENLKFKEMEFHKAIDHFEVSVKEKHLLQLRNLQLKEDLQERVNELDFQLRNIKKQQVIRGRISKSSSDRTPFALSALMEENTKLQQDNLELSKRVQEMAEELKHLRSLLQIVTEENANLSVKWAASAKDKVHIGMQVKEYQSTVSDLKSRLSSVTAAHDQLLQEKIQASQKLQQMVLDKEEIIKDRAKLIQAMDNSPSEAETKKAQEEYRNLQTEYRNIKHEYGVLNSKHQDFLNRYGEEAKEEKEKQEMTKMRTERDALLKQVTSLHCQLSQTEDSKKQADDQLTRLTSELEEAKAELKLSSDSHKVSVPSDFDEESSLKQKFETLQKQMAEFQECTLQQKNSPYDKSQDALHTLHCKSLDFDSFSDTPGSTEPSKTQQKGHYGGCFFNMPEKSDMDENSRLQNLISKYASEREAAEHHLAAKPLSRADSPKTFSKSRFNQRAT